MEAATLFLRLLEPLTLYGGHDNHVLADEQSKDLLKRQAPAIMQNLIGMHIPGEVNMLRADAAVTVMISGLAQLLDQEFDL